MYGTKVDYLADPEYTSEQHSTHYVRYFMGHKYYIVENHNFMTAPKPRSFGVGTMYWTIFNRYISIYGGGPKISFRQKFIYHTGPSVMQRTIDALVPDDIQAVPF